MKNPHVLKRRLVLLAATLAIAVHINGASKKGKEMAPEIAQFELGESQQTLLFSVPLYRGASVEETPYQWVQLCDSKQTCKTLADLRGSGALTMPANSRLGLSPDKRFVLCLQFVAADAATKTYRQHYYVIYDLSTLELAAFRTVDGKDAETGNIRGWAKDQPHALEIGAGIGKTALALPVE